MHIYAEPNQWGSYDIYLDGVYWRRYRLDGDRVVKCSNREGIAVIRPVQAQIEEVIWVKMKEQRDARKTA